MIKSDVTDDKVTQVLAAKKNMLEPLSVYLHHDAITGTDKQFVADDYSFKMGRGIYSSTELYKNELERALYKYTGIEVNTELSTCN